MSPMGARASQQRPRDIARCVLRPARSSLQRLRHRSARFRPHSSSTFTILPPILLWWPPRLPWHRRLGRCYTRLYHPSLRRRRRYCHHILAYHCHSSRRLDRFITSNVQPALPIHPILDHPPVRNQTPHLGPAMAEWHSTSLSRAD